MNQSELAKLSGRSPSTVSLVIRKKRSPSVSTALIFSKITGSSLKVWVDGTVEERIAVLERAKFTKYWR